MRTIPARGACRVAFPFAAFALWVATALSTPAFAQSAPPMLFGPPAFGADAAQPREQAVTRARNVSIAHSILDLAAAQLKQHPGVPFEATLNLFDDATQVVQLTRVESLPDGTLSFTGSVAGDPLSSVAIVSRDAIVSANFQSGDGRTYQLRFRGGGVHETREIDRRQFREHPADAPLPPKDAAKDELVTSMTDDASTVDVMVVYTPQARAAAGGTAAMQSLVNLGITETNAAYSNSGVTQRVRLVYSGEVTYNDTGNMDADLTNLAGTGDAYLPEVHTLRNTYGADIVSLWVENGAACGIGYFMATVTSAFAPSAFNVVARSCATGNYSFGHEMGHNMGLMHDVYMDSRSSPYPYAHGYVDLTGRWRTIMAYNDQCAATSPYTSCTRIQYFSNPSVLYGGRPTGLASTADARSALNNTALTVANFRTSVASGSPPSAPTAISPSGSLATTTMPTYVWNSSSGATSYTLLVQNTSGVAVNIVYTAAAAGCSAGGTCSATPATPLTSGASYNWFVNALNSAGTSAWSAGLAITIGASTPPPTSPPAAPTTVSPSGSITTTTPVYTWSAVSGASSYYLLVQNTAGVLIGTSYTATAAGCAAGTGTCSITPATALASGSTYNWFVSATNSVGTSAWSAARTISVGVATANVWPPSCAVPSTTGWTNAPSGATTGWSVATDSTSEGSCSLKANPMSSSVSSSVLNKAQIQFTGSFTAGNVTFDRRVVSEPGFDCLQFFVDGAAQAIGGGCSYQANIGGASGSVAWGPVSIAISAGTHTLLWSYEKDYSIDALGEGAWIDNLVMPLATISTPAAPTTIAPTGTIATTTPAYSWNASAGATTYNLLVQNTAGALINTSFAASALGCGAGTGTCTITPPAALSGGSTYNWFVSAANSSGTSAWSAARTITVNVPAPSPPPVPVTVSPTGTLASATPTYTWNAASGAESYMLLVQNTAGAIINTSYAASAVGCASGGTCSITPAVALAAGATYNWFVNATNANGTSAWSAARSITAPGTVTPPPPPPGTLTAPTQVAPTGTITTTTPTYTWNAVSVATSYYLLVQNTAGVAVGLTLSPTAAGCGSGMGTCSIAPATALANGSAYNWFVNASTSSATSAWSAGLAFAVSGTTPTPSPPSAPTIVSPSGTITTNSPTYTWNASAGAASYYLLVQNTAGVAVGVSYSASSVGCGSGAGTCSVTPAVALANGNIYNWFVNATNSLGTSAWSAATTITVSATGPSVPLAPVTVSPTGTLATTTPTYTWNASAGATSYYLLVQNTAGVRVGLSLAASSIGCGAGTGTCAYMPATALANGTVYNWFVNATNSLGTSPWSAARTITAP